MATDKGERTVAPASAAAAAAANKKQQQPVKKSGGGLPLWLIRATMLFGVVLVPTFLPSLIPFYTLLVAGLAHATIYFTLRLFNWNDDEWALGCKRFLNFLNGFATGVPAIFAVMGAYKGDPYWSFIAAGIQLGVYTSDMLFLTDKQREMMPLVVHHYITFFGNFGILWSANYLVMSIGLCMELTNPFWYGNVLLKFHLKASEETLDISRMFAIYSYILIRFVFVTHKVIEHTYPMYMRFWPTVEGVVFLLVTLGFTWVNINNLVKLMQSGGPRRKKE
jgi:hypothetical protein